MFWNHVVDTTQYIQFSYFLYTEILYVFGESELYIFVTGLGSLLFAAYEWGHEQSTPLESTRAVRYSWRSNHHRLCIPYKYLENVFDFSVGLMLVVYAKIHIPAHGSTRQHNIGLSVSRCQHTKIWKYVRREVHLMFWNHLVDTIEYVRYSYKFIHRDYVCLVSQNLNMLSRVWASSHSRGISEVMSRAQNIKVRAPWDTALVWTTIQFLCHTNA
jgi:hypothetical protein